MWLRGLSVFTWFVSGCVKLTSLLAHVWHCVHKCMCLWPYVCDANRTFITDLITLSHPTGDVVPTEQCPGDPPPLQKPCEMPCPDDCVLGQWSSWSSCSHCCSSKQVQGKQKRSRVILAPSGQRKTFLPLSEHITNAMGGEGKREVVQGLILIIIYGKYGCAGTPSVKIALNYWLAWGLKLICTTSQSCGKIKNGNKKSGWISCK